LTDHEPDLPDLGGIPDPFAGMGDAPPALVPQPAAQGPTRRDLSHGRRLALIVGAAWLVGQLVVTGLRDDWQQVPLAYVLGFGIAPIAAGLLCLVAAVSPGRLGLGVRVALLATLALALPLGFVLASVLDSPPYPGAPLGLFKHGVFCFNIALAWTLLPLIAAGFALRGTFVTRPTWRSALVGAGCGLVVSATSMLRCPLSGPWHMALSHGGAVIAAALLGAFVLARVTRA
jgi:Negative regulator of sigma F